MNRRSFLAAAAGTMGLGAVSRAFSSDDRPFFAADCIKVTNEQELAEAVENVAPGDEIVIAPGIYEDVEVEVGIAATEDFPVIIRASADHEVVFTGQTQFLVTGTHLQFRGLRFARSEEVPQYGVFDLRGAAHCRITNCEFEDLEGMWGTVVIHYGARENRIDSNHFADCRHRAVRVGVHEEALEHGPPTYNRIDHNIIRDIPDSGGGSAEAIALGSWGYPWNQYETYTVIENNLFLRCNGENELITVKTRANIIRDNAFIHCVAGELVLRSTDDTTVEGNRFEYTNHGIRVHGSGHRVVHNVIVHPSHTGIRVAYGSDDPTHPTTYNRVRSAVVANNTIVNAGDAGIRVGDFKGNTASYNQFTEPPFNHPTGKYTLDVAPRSCVFANNVVVGEEGILLEIIDSPDNIYSNNLLYADADAQVGDPGDRPILEKPEFRWPENGDYRLDEDSPGSGAGAESGFPIMPIDQQRPYVYEVGAEGGLPEVGPSEERVAEVLALPPVYLDEELPPSSYHIRLLDG